MAEKKAGVIIILSSPSGAGKTTLVKKISSRKSLMRSGSGSLDEELSNSPKINTSKDSSPV